jgi:hypothetical protein
MSKGTCLIIILFLRLTAFSQVNIDKFPKNLQLYPRDNDDKSIVQISGQVTDNTVTKSILEIYRNGILIQSFEAPINSFQRTFVFNPTIKAELAEYSFKLLLESNNNQKTLVRQATQVVCGEAILLYGQSNMNAIPGTDYFNLNESDQFMRNFDFPIFGNYDPNTLTWHHAKEPYANVGVLGSYLMKFFRDTYQIPVCVINPSIGGRQLNELSQRNPNNHFDTQFYYGRMLSRLKESGLLNHIKYMAYRQGEAEAGSYYLLCDNYPNEFQIFYNQLHEDIPNLKKIYIYQNHVMMQPYVERAGFVRDFQRKVKDLYSDVESIATVGTTHYDGAHYQREGYVQGAVELFQLLSRDFYGSLDVYQINSPNIQYAYYNAPKDSLTLVFDEGQQMVYPPDSIDGNFTWRLKDFLLFSNTNYNINNITYFNAVESGFADGNKIKLKLNQAVSYPYLTYTPPSYFVENRFYNGVNLKNSIGKRAMTFYMIPILNNPPTSNPIPNAPQNLTAISISDSHINLNWIDKSDNENEFVIEGSYDGMVFSEIKKNPFNSVIHTEQKLIKNKQYYFRVKACNINGCSAYSNISEAKTKNISLLNCQELNLNIAINNKLEEFKGTSISAQSSILNQSRITLKAPKIELNNGFRVENSVFETKIEGCSN